MKKGTCLIVSGVLFFIMALSGPLPSSAQVNEGRWEVTTEMIMEGMPFKMPPTKTTQCITKEDMVPKNSGKESNCKVLDQRVTGNKVSWKVRCVDSHGTTDGEGEITYSGNSYRGSMSARMTDPSGQSQSVKMKLAGQRIGDCTPAALKEKERIKDQVDHAKSAQKDYDTKIKRAEELASTIKIPEPPANACLLSDNACNARFSKLNLNDGEWEITEEGTTTVRDAKAKTKTAEKAAYTPVTTQTSTRCLTEQIALSYSVEPNCKKEEKRNGDRVTWKSVCTMSGTTIEERGTVHYSGDRYEAAKIRKVNTSAGDTTQLSQIKGRRTGNGTCVAVRDTSPGRKMPTPVAGKAPTVIDQVTEGVVEKPVKALKKIFGF